MEAQVAADRREVAALAAQIAAAEDLGRGDACRSVARAVGDWARAQAPAARAEGLLVDRLLDWEERNGHAERP